MMLPRCAPTKPPKMMPLQEMLVMTKTREPL